MNPRLYLLSRNHEECISKLMDASLSSCNWDFSFRRNPNDCSGVVMREIRWGSLVSFKSILEDGS